MVWPLLGCRARGAQDLRSGEDAAGGDRQGARTFCRATVCTGPGARRRVTRPVPGDVSVPGRRPGRAFRPAVLTLSRKQDARHSDVGQPARITRWWSAFDPGGVVRAADRL